MVLQAQNGHPTFVKNLYPHGVNQKYTNPVDKIRAYFCPPQQVKMIKVKKGIKEVCIVKKTFLPRKSRDEKR
ncbi:MAG: hypothetical protein LBS03_11640 [Bacteroidales bacterium]|jgi:hypothetical protein|nr:hypothetical protein [Bacteroidales bacterium]